MNLYQLSARYEQLLNKEELSGDELIEIEMLNDSIEDKVIELAKHLKNKEIELDAVSESIKAMTARKGRIEKSINSLSRLIISMMDIGGLKKITKSPLFQIKSVKNSPSVVINESSLVPSEYTREVISVNLAVDKLKVKEAIQQGITVPGCSIVQNNRIKFS